MLQQLLLLLPLLRLDFSCNSPLCFSLLLLNACLQCCCCSCLLCWVDAVDQLLQAASITSSGTAQQVAEQLHASKNTSQHTCCDASKADIGC
jgi:hypothetical protein